MSQSVCVLGGTGFVGRELVRRLASDGLSVKVLSRRGERHGTLAAQATVQEADVHDPRSLAEHLAGSRAAINLVGILNERGHDGSGFRHAHVALAHKLVEACKTAGVSRLLHMSALGADAARGPSHYLRTKGEAEDYVHAQADDTLAVTSFRPSVIFGPGDSFLNRFATVLKLAPVLPLACPEARFAPVYVGDVAHAFAAALDDTSSHARRIELCGPREYTLEALVRYTAELTRRRRWIVGLPDPLSRLQANLFEYVPGKPLSVDNYRSLSVDSVCRDGAACATTLESVAPQYLGR